MTIYQFLLSAILLYFFTFSKIAKSVRNPHEDFSKVKHVKRFKNGLPKLPTSHKFLNAVQRWKEDPYVGRIQHSYNLLPHGYSGREKVEELIEQRDKH